MSTLVLDLPPNLLERLTIEAKRRQQAVEEVASTLLSEDLSPPSEPEDERNRVEQVLREAGMLVYLADGLRSRIDAKVSHEDVVAALGHAGGKPLSEIVMEQRRPSRMSTLEAPTGITAAPGWGGRWR